MTDSSIRLDKGIFTLSLDFELIWGTIDRPNWQSHKRLCEIERAEVIDGLLSLFAEYEIPATWCTVGHLFLDRCHPGSHACAHPIADPRISRDPGSSEQRDPIFYGRELIQKIRRCPVPQEIGSHSFTHVIFDDPNCTREVAASEFAACVRAAEAMGLHLDSFAFPRNRVRHAGLLAEHGFSIFRSENSGWYDRAGQRRWFHRVGHLFDILTAGAPSTVLPSLYCDGLWEVPGSMLYTPSFGIRRFIPCSLRVARARKGLAGAAAEKRIFHLWFHPKDVVVRQRAMLQGLREIFETVAELRAAGKLCVAPMRAIPALIQEAPLRAAHAYEPRKPEVAGARYA